jgi:serine/threonine-protein kinase
VQCPGAIAVDPRFAPAWAGLARAEYWIADSAETPREVSEGQQRARAAAEKSVALGPEAPEGYVARGFLRATVEFDWTGAQSDFARALAISPEDADLMREYIASVLRPVGRGDEMVTVARKAAALDPLNSASWTADC